MTGHKIFPLRASPGMPPRNPLAMPVQRLDRSRPVLRERVTPAVAVARLIAFGGAGLLTAMGTYEMTQVVAVGGTTVLEGIMAALFAVSFCWIALSACAALAGLLVPPMPHIRLGRTGGRLATRTALVMPIYNEDPIRTTAALEVMARGLHGLGEAHAFEIVILSDSMNADSWVAETLAADRLRTQLQGIMPVWYRRRWANIGKKAGNVQEFVENWGGRYPHFIVLDADSLMSPETMVTLAAGMEIDSKLGLLQTVPTLACGRTVFARLQQFANRVYGPIVSRGMAAWQGSDGNYWGHNAIIRTRAFASACGLPELGGRKPFGGKILSHDFVEAALMRRAGWRVEMAPRLEGSWEESPPSLIDAAQRDRRWAQGNLQHLKVITARGLTWTSRAHLAIGVMSYLASPIWLGLIVFGFLLSLQAHFIPPDYFSDTFQLFPTWPHFDSERMVRLFEITLFVLLFPKLAGLARALWITDLRRGCGGAVTLFASFVTEVVVSALLAPIMMAIHSRQVYEILIGRDAGWSPQRRDNGETGWRDTWRFHRWHTGLGIGAAATAWFLFPAVLGWLLPTLAGLFLAAPLSRMSGSRRVGAMLMKAGLLTTLEERNPPSIFAARDEAVRESPPLPGDGIRALASDTTVRSAHYRWTNSAPRLRGSPDPAYLTATDKVHEARTLEEALAWLGHHERVHVAGHKSFADRLAMLPEHDDPGPAGAEIAPPSERVLDFEADRGQVRPSAA